MDDRVTVIVMAAGEGKRLKSTRPKVLHQLAGRSMLGHVLAAAAPLAPAKTLVVVSTRGPEIQDAVRAEGSAEGIDYVVQDPPRGTGDAVKVALEHVGDAQRVLILPGDSPLISTAVLEALLDAHDAAGATGTVVTSKVFDPTGYGRILRDEAGAVAGVIEERDASEDQRKSNEVNAGFYVFDVAALGRMLDKVDNVNAQKEYYLTDVIELFAREGLSLQTFEAPEDEVMGINSRPQLARATALLRERTCSRWMDEGVTIVDPASTFIDPTVTIGSDTVILPFSFLEGASTIGSGVELGPQARVIDSSIGDGAVVTFAVVRGSSIGPRATVGPFASIRAGTTLGENGRIGTFVETKSTSIDAGSKIPHLSYVGDAEIGPGVNVGAGTITCNWDGTSKHKTIVDEDVYIGSDTMLVAPVHLGARSATGAGSVVRGDVPADALAVGVPARIIEGQGNKMDKVPPPESEEAGKVGPVQPTGLDERREGER
ncbi:MAG TPA: bifunctional UDP-N-acetylglucosamine diphosphorylase/glucosamine-1-phosphate N-acetyltransferase GlmU [Actinomycetota bacterium]|nr:bifunctional UDP-N-acetylglucosamine diphosphorylase/glucosamine-1-phosphate N-acetyltransferase GlmU [Actinomycetota bacterium]